MGESQASNKNRWRSRLARFVRHTLLGVLITVVLGLFCAWLKWDRTYGGWTILETPLAGAQWPATVPEGWPPTPTSANQLWGEVRVGSGMLIHHHVIFRRLKDSRYPSSASEILTYKVCAFGWPFPSLRFDVAEEEITYPGSDTIRDVDYYMNVASFPWRGVEIRRGSKKPKCVLPIMPYWRGFAANVAFWAGFTALLPRVARAMRRGKAAKRIARGQCPKCRYPIGSTPICPECGEHIPRDSCLPPANADCSHHLDS